jgi:EAL domain-containing protein (putative c-di-GMP-specific phosphodiesterase class I)
VLEVTERAGLEGLSDIAARVARLRGMGFRIGLDDLGAGDAGLNVFASIDPEYVKLDRELVRDVHRHPRKLTLVASLISLCRQLGVKVIAEGVETPEERDALLGTGCDLFQGFLFARPGPGLPEVRW